MAGHRESPIFRVSGGAMEGKEVVASSAKTGGGQSASILTPGAKFCVIATCTAASGTSPTLDLIVDWSINGTTWTTNSTRDTTGGSFTDHATTHADRMVRLTSASATAIVVHAKAQFFRIRWVIGGTTPSFTFSVDTLVL